MILPELLLSTSLISLAIFLWTFLHQWKGDGCPEDSTGELELLGWMLRLGQDSRIHFLDRLQP